MEITVSIADHRSLSRSDMIQRKLYSSVQIGNTCHSGNGVLIQGAKFRSGTVENPLILTLRNSQTETVMYVRNIPISTVLERNGLFEQWIAVYPPGDPQNFHHFDAAALPREACPQVCISIAVREEDLCTGASPRRSVAFEPPPRLGSKAEAAGPELPGWAPLGAQGSENTEPEPLRQPSELQAALGSRSLEASRLADRPSAHAPHSGTQGVAGEAVGGILDGSFQLKAQRLKEHVAEVASAARRAQDVKCSLQESRRIRDDLRRQLRGLEEQIAEQQAATRNLERDTGQLRAEEAQLKEQISQRNAVFQELRNSRDEIDRQLSRALGEGERRRTSMDASSRDFALQRQTMVADIEHSKQQTSHLQARLKGSEEALAEGQRNAAREALAREALQAALSQTRADLASARASLGEQQAAYGRLDARRRETSAQLAQLEGGDTSSRAAPGDASAELEAKRGKIKAQVSRASRLEQELNENRGQLERMSSRIAELHAEAHERELAAKQCEAARVELERQLEARRANIAPLHEQQHESEEHLARAEQEVERARDALKAAECAAAVGGQRRAQEAADLELALQGQRDRLAHARAESDALRGLCQDLEATASGSRRRLQDRGGALEAARGRAAELTRRLSAASAAGAAGGDALRRLGQELTARSARLEEAQRQARLREREVSALQEEGARIAETRDGRLADLDGTAAQIRGEIERLQGAKQQADMQRLDLEGSLEVNERSLAELQKQIDSLLSAHDEGSRELEEMVCENEAVASQLQQGGVKLASLEEASSVHEADLDATRQHIAAKMQKVSELELVYKKEVAQMQASMASLTEEQEENRKVNERLSGELLDLESESHSAAQAVASGRQQQETLHTQLEQALAKQEQLHVEHSDRLDRTEALARDAAAGAKRGLERKERVARQLREAEDASRAAGLKLATVREEVECEADKLQVAQSQLNARRGSLASLRTELENQQAEALRMRALGIDLEREVEELTVKLGQAGQASLEVRRLERRYLELQEQQRLEQQRHQEALAQQGKDLEETREQLQRRGSEALQRREAEIAQHAEQISKLEAEREQLLRQVGQLDVDRRALEDALAERGREHRDASAACRREAHECEGLERATREARGAATRLERREADLEQLLDEALRREAAAGVEARAAAERLGSARAELEAEVDGASRRAQGEAEHLRVQKEALAVAEQKAQELQDELDTLGLEEAALVRERETVEAAAGERNRTFQRLRGELEQATAENERQRSLARERSSQLAQHRSEAEQRAKRAGEAEVLQHTVLQLEESLQQLGDKLVSAQEVVRRERAEEEELRLDIQKLKESIRVTNDKTLYQVEHGNLQYETIQKLEEQKRKFEHEVELLTLGLHDAEQRIEFLQTENKNMQQQVEGLHNGSVQEWAFEVHQVKVAAEVARYKEEIDTWKQRAENARRDRQQRLSGLQRRHEEAVQHLRERIASTQAEVERCEQTLRKREAALARRQDRGEAAPAGAVPGLVVPQRPLPSDAGRRRALLVGVNYAASHAPLKGCVNDVWNLQCLLRYTLQYSEDQLQVLLDCADGRPSKPKRAPTKANILQGLQWLLSSAQPGDNLLLVFCGYGAQHPRSPGSSEHEAYLVPSDFAADLPADFFPAVPSASPASGNRDAGTAGREPGRGAGRDAGVGYRLLSLLEVHDWISRLPAGCRMSVVLDCCYSAIPHVSPASNFSPTFGKVEWGHIDYTKFRDFISRPRFLELPVLPVQHTPGHFRAGAFPSCLLHCFSGCRREEWCAEFPIEGTVQGAFSWAFLKALAKAHFHCGVYQFQQMLAQMLSDLKVHFKAVEQRPLLQLSQSAGIQDVVLWT